MDSCKPGSWGWTSRLLLVTSRRSLTDRIVSRGHAQYWLEVDLGFGKQLVSLIPCGVSSMGFMKKRH